MSLPDAVLAARRAGDLDALVRAIPYARFLGITAREDEGEPACTLPFRDGLVGNAALPAIHGGVVGAFLEHVAILHLLWRLDESHVPKTITITVDYLRPALARDTHARASVTKLGRRVANVRVEAWQEDRARPVAHAVAHFLLSPAADGARRDPDTRGKGG